jgi:cell division protein FtsW
MFREKSKKKSSIFKFKATRPLDKSLLSAILLLLIFGLVVLFSASLVTAYSSRGGDAYFFVRKQLVFVFVGVFFLFLLSKINYHVFKKVSFLFLGLALLALVLVFVPGIGNEFGGSRRWLVIFGLSFQVADIVKFLLIFYLAAWVEARKSDLKRFKTGLVPFLLVVVIIGVLFLAQPDLGSFLLVLIISLAIYFVADGNMKYLIILALICLIGVSYIFYNINNPDSLDVIKDYQLNRIKCLQDPFFDKDICYQVNQSLIAVGSGGIWGRGLGNSLQKFNYLPEVWADSIFPVIAEEFGFVGSLLLILIYSFIFLKGIAISKRAPDMYGRALAVGISVWIFFQAFLNIGGMINLISITGVPLPFISAGGTSLFVLLASCGVLLNIDRQGLEKRNRKRKIIN